MRLTIVVAAAAAGCLTFTGCGTGLQPLKTAEAPRALSRLQPLPQKIPVPVVVTIHAPDSVPTLDAKHTYPLKQYLEKAFRDAAKAAFVEGVPGSYAYSLEITVNSSQLRVRGKKAIFKSEINAILRDPDNRIKENDNLLASAESSFDRKQVPESVWAGSYQSAEQVLKLIRKARWLKVALKDTGAKTSGAQGGGARDAGETMGAGAHIDSDVDKPEYRLPEDPKKYALVIGIEKYSNIPDATFAERDAESMKEHLIALGYPERNILYATGPKAVRSSITKYVETWLPKNLNSESQLFVYFSGHGAPDVKTGDAYLLPWEADPQDLESTAYPVKRLYEKLNALPAKEVLVAMDSCFSGAGGRSVIAEGTRPLVTHLNKAVPEGKLVVFAAADGEQVTGAEQAQGHGLFTYHFLKGLNGGAKDKKGMITVRGLYDYLLPKVKDAARRDNRDQTPQLMGADAAKSAQPLVAPEE